MKIFFNSLYVIPVLAIVVGICTATKDASAKTLPIINRNDCVGMKNNLESNYQRSAVYHGMAPSTFLSRPSVGTFHIKCPDLWDQFKLDLADIYAAAVHQVPEPTPSIPSTAGGTPNYNGNPPGSGGSSPGL